MSSIARFLVHQKKCVIGYDKTPSQLTHILESEGIKIHFEDKIELISNDLTPENTLVIYTPAIKELRLLNFFKEKDFRIIKRAEMLGQITRGTRCIAIAGTHGKTTTSSLVAHLAKEAGLNFSAFLGGISENFGSNFYYQGDEFSIVEADEYDRSFLQLSPEFAAITSTDADHLDIYGTRECIESSFQEFAKKIRIPEHLFLRKGVAIDTPGHTYAVNEMADYFSDNIRLHRDQIAFDFHTPDGRVSTMVWDIPGTHNVENATVALAILLKIGANLDSLKSGIRSFKGIKRRFTRKRFPSGKVLIDDYAHHPTELNAVISSVRALYPGKKLLCVFQPHLFTRTRDFAEDFAQSLSQVDELILLDIYPAREEPMHGITSEWLLEKVNLENKEVQTLERALQSIENKEFDILLTVGAGNIDTLFQPLVNWLSL